MIKAVFFDLGHTLTREVDISKKIEALLRPYKLSWEKFYSSWEKVYFLRSIGKISNDREMFLLLEKIFERKNMPLRELKNIIIFESHIIPKENIEIIKEIRKKYKVALITNFVYEWLEKILKKKKIHGLFDLILVSSKLGIRKPNAKIFYIALNQFSIKPDEALFISDDFYSDLICAKGCGIKTIWIDRGIESKEEERKMSKIFSPDGIVKNLKEITLFLKRM